MMTTRFAALALVLTGLIGAATLRARPQDRVPGERPPDRVGTERPG